MRGIQNEWKRTVTMGSALEIFKMKFKLVISFNPFWVFSRFKKSAWDFLQFDFGVDWYLGG